LQLAGVAGIMGDEVRLLNGWDLQIQSYIPELYTCSWHNSQQQTVSSSCKLVGSVPLLTQLKPRSFTQLPQAFGYAKQLVSAYYAAALLLPSCDLA
jgi:hypothetical protein